MDREAVYERARQLMGQSRAHPDREQGYIFHHGLRVAEQAIALARETEAKADEELLWAAGLFHDVGKGLEPHWKSGEVLARLHLEELADSPEQLDQIVHLVRYHARRYDLSVMTTELRLLQDADILDHRGTMEAWLAIGSAVARGEGPEAVYRDHFSPERRQRREEFRQMLHFEQARLCFDQRIAAEENFYQAMGRELGEHRGG
jgi:uncharacterized protein